MPYVERDENGNIIGRYANFQEGYAEEFLEDDHPDLNPGETAEQIIARLESGLDRYLDEVAKSKRYESIRTMVTYAASEHPIFGNEGRAALKLRDAVYQKGIDILQAVQAGERAIPTEEELIAEMPSLDDFLQPAE